MILWIPLEWQRKAKKKWQLKKSQFIKCEYNATVKSYQSAVDISLIILPAKCTYEHIIGYIYVMKCNISSLLHVDFVLFAM